MPEPSTFWLFALASLILLLTPGPGAVYIVTRSLEGRRAGLASMLGIEAGDACHVAAAALGLTALLNASAAAFAVVRYAGAAYLVVLGLRRLLAAHEEPDEPAGRGAARLFWSGVAVQVLNPKAAVFFVAFLPQFIDPSHSVAGQTLALGALYIALGVAVDAAYVLLAGLVGGWLRADARRRRRLTRSSGCVYVTLGVAAAVSGGRPSDR